MTKKKTDVLEVEKKLNEKRPRSLQMSLRASEATIAKIEKIQAIIEKEKGIPVDRSVILRKALEYGINKYCETYGLNLGEEVESSDSLKKTIDQQIQRRHEREETVKKKPAKKKRKAA